MGTQTGYRRRTRACGHTPKGRPETRAITFEIDQDTFEQAADHAHKRHVSLGQFIRECVEWGLMADTNGEAA
jgi:hypothetical protein